MINCCSVPVRSIVYYTFTNQAQTLSSDNTRLYSQELNEACASKIIDEEQTLNMEHPKIKKIIASWRNLNNTFRNLKPETFEHLECEYPDIFIDLDSSDFWKEIMGVRGILF